MIDMDIDWNYKVLGLAVGVALITTLCILKISMWDTTPLWMRIITPILALVTTYVVGVIVVER